ncbi:MurR/RpiR family transcriptional regulator [Corynebacterium sp. TA-R-1]|uniref:MurR/RpiR family transcriptional regulator n=1 Tax=Corynebacterium stercoris TaxID=2943490 RepID=A0ABT1G0W8_9CORY|nr:MurR/RpiR family transcriptional regulator [Corynebacterium stercoris]MCP1387668.1 MurR/RpiR family transcriptional regulator [Corynebacterium stercoris]
MSSLQPKERAVAEAISADPATAVEMTAQQLADHVGVSRASVVRTAQSLGYSGFPQLRVALAQQIAGAPQASAVSGEGSPLDTLRHNVAEFSRRLHASFAALDEASFSRAVHLLDAADRVLVVANGLSAPLGLDLTQRLISAGRPAEFHADAMTQRIAAHSLGEGSVCFVFSGSGANRATLDVVAQARASGAAIIAATSFAPSSLTDLADVVLLVPPVDPSFRAELLHTSRAALMVLTEQLVEALHAERGERSTRWRAAVLDLVSESLEG